MSAKLQIFSILIVNRSQNKYLNHMHPLNMKVIDICEEMKVKQAKRTGHQAIYVNLALFTIYWTHFFYNTTFHQG